MPACKSQHPQLQLKMPMLSIRTMVGFGYRVDAAYKDIQLEDMIGEDPKQLAEHFLSICHMFKLGCLQTEMQHPHTIGLSDLAKNDLPAAISRIKDLDVNTIQVLTGKLGQLCPLAKVIQETLDSGGRIFVCGCGATGRLSLVLETLWRQECKALGTHDLSERVVSFMAGGDAALIKSVEDFEDHPEFAEQQLTELGFANNDLLIGSTEGGETPWVIGAVWKATTISKRKPYILYGNTDEVLKQNVERSRKFIESELIEKINMNVGSMAVSGSTRMQSTTILMYGIGLGLLGYQLMRDLRKETGDWLAYATSNVNTFMEYTKATDFSVLARLIEFESELYKKNEHVSYLTDSYYAISILTDTTERAPTFSLNAFENVKDEKINACWCNMVLLTQPCEYSSNDQHVKANWQEMLGGRPLRTLDSQYWVNYVHKVSQARTLGYQIHQKKQHSITIEHPLKFIAEGLEIEPPKYPSACRLSHHVLLKILLNNHSTLIMGRLGRYESNVMTFVRASNYKLIDRAARCIMMLHKGPSYDRVVHKIFEIKQQIREDEPIVMKVVEFFRQESKAKND